jgi:hypothetical protein
MDEQSTQLVSCMYQYSRAIYRSIKDLVDPYAAPEQQLEFKRSVLDACEQTMVRLATDPHYFAKPDRALFQDIRRYYPITVQAQVGWAVEKGISAAGEFIQKQIEPARARPVSVRHSPSATTAPHISTSSGPESQPNNSFFSPTPGSGALAARLVSPIPRSRSDRAKEFPTSRSSSCKLAGGCLTTPTS